MIFENCIVEVFDGAIEGGFCRVYFKIGHDASDRVGQVIPGTQQVGNIGFKGVGPFTGGDHSIDDRSRTDIGTEFRCDKAGGNPSLCCIEIR